MGDRDADIERLRESEERFRTICEHAPVMIDAFDERGNCVLWNRECEKRLGWTRAEVDASDDPLALCYGPEDRDRVLESIARADGRFREYRVRAKDGSTRIQMWADFRLPTGASISVGHDVTEQREVELQLQQAQKMEAVGQLTGGLAHDFNNLLTVVMANIDVVSARTDLPPDAARALRRVTEAAQRGAALVRHMMAFSRPGSLVLEAVDLAGLLSHVVPALRRVLPETIDLRISATPDTAVALADATAVEQIVLNLVTNARDALDGVGSLHLSVRTERVDRGHGLRGVGAPGEYAVLAVQDDGPGIPAREHDRVFEPFFTTKPLGVGTGLGLATIDALVRHHGGLLRLSSAPGEGTRIEVFLPVCDSPRRTPSTAPPPPTLALGSLEVLVVEDEPDVRDATARLLRRLGYGVRVATDGVDALEVLAEAGPVDLVLSDVVMPRMSGPELCETLREQGRRVPFVLMTGYAPERGYPRAPAGVPVLEKPWTVPQLCAALQLALEAAAEPD